MPLTRLPLPRAWTLVCDTNRNTRPELPQAISAIVPGTVHTDLMAEGLLADPYLDLNEISADWVGHQDWTYAVDFDWQESDARRFDLVCEGLDTFAAISVNGAEVAETRNMNRSYRFNIGEHLTPGGNRLKIAFRSALQVGEELAAAIEPRPNNYPGPANLMRKMACNFGWDWGPTLVTAGIWKPIGIESWSVARLASVRPQVSMRGAKGHVVVDIDVERDGESSEALHVVVQVAGVRAEGIVAAGESSAKVSLEVESPQVWWPHGLGAQPLYELEVGLTTSSGEVLDNWSKRVGFRSIRLDTSADDIGSAFTFIVNDVPVFICGANWIPDDCFLPCVTAERYGARIAQAKAANINMLRVWGGGIYETDAFYDACDEAGVMVWQDFLFACAAYPEEGELRGEIEAEARDNVVRLMPHASLVLWNGNNENIWGWFDWGWQEALDGKSWGLGYYLDILPKIVAELDPTRPYWAGSPYSGNMDIHPNADEHGCKHIWDVWNEVGYEAYRNYVPRFCSEFGWQAPPTWATLTEAIHDTPITPDSPGVSHHQKATAGNAKLLRGLARHLPMPTNTDDWHYVTQLNQARALHFGIAHMRSHRPTCMGAIVWQLNDCWPVNSWSAIDGYGRRKPLWYALRSVYADHLLTIQPRADGLRLFAINERTLFWRSAVKLQRVRFDGTVLAEYNHWRLGVDRLSAESLAIPADVATPGDPRNEMIVATMLDSKAYWFFNEDIELDLPEPRAEIIVASDGADWRVTVTARTFLRDLCLFVDRIHPDAEIDDMMINLLPEESHVFRVTCPSPITPAMLSASPVFRCVNQLPKVDASPTASGGEDPVFA